jgi:hypothetical protein
MTDRENELFNALVIAEEHLHLDTDFRVSPAVYISPAQALRNRADEVEEMEKDILYIRQVIEKYSAEKEAKS